MMKVSCTLHFTPLSTSITRYKIPLSISSAFHSNFCSFNSLSKLKTLYSFTNGETEKRKGNKSTITNGDCAVSSSFSVTEPPTDDFIVVNFYRFVFIKDPRDEVSKHLSFLKDLDIHGRIYVNEQGINAQFSGPSKHALSYVEWLKEDSRFSDILVQISPACNGHAFPKLKLRYKPSLVQLEGGISHLPLLDSSMRATPLAPSEWRKRLEAEREINGTPNSNVSSNFVLLDVRNGYEWDIGHFTGAQRPETDCFRSTSCGLSQKEVIASDPLANADKDSTHIFMYCTGGIRCDVYSSILREEGFQNLYTLSGGVSHYLNKEGPKEWEGNLFVFDDRLSLPPSDFNPDDTKRMSKTQQISEKYSFANCYMCGSHVHELRHRNCANIDCNLLFLCCMDCLKDFRGCCCLECTSAPRLRPPLPANQRYNKWHIYREIEVQTKS
ncbi:rhodanese-like domain-containing protein 8, chloroplastic [Euphorbia lathyris]|uniref:rhodanese-like domain-containing protein 8, chloroplastic n=1 Tax=Euphorbia lathyris TaxID=212925 RepID=UPI003313C9B1